MATALSAIIAAAALCVFAIFELRSFSRLLAIACSLLLVCNGFVIWGGNDSAHLSFIVTTMLVASALFLLSAYLAPTARGRRSFGLASAIAVLGTIGCYLTTQPIHRDSPNRPRSLLLYLGVSDESVLTASRQWVESEIHFADANHRVTIIGVPGAASLVNRVWREASFEAVPNDWAHGVTLERLFPDIERRLQGIAEAIPVVVVAPRATNIAEASFSLGSAIKACELLQENLHFLPVGAIVGAAQIRMPDVGEIIITAPNVLAQGSSHWPVHVHIDSGQLSSTVGPGGLIFDPSRAANREIMPLDFENTSGNPGRMKLFPDLAVPPVEPPRSPTVRLDKKSSFGASGQLPAPRPNSPAAIMIEVRTKYETVLAASAFVSEAKPQFLVLRKKGDTSPNLLLDYCKAAGLDARSAELDLTTSSSITVNAEQINDFPVLIVGCPLSGNEWGVLRDTVAKVTPNISLLFVGSGRTAADPQGWLDDVLTGFPVDPNGLIRTVGFAWDNSGSMGQSVSSSNPKKRFEVIQEMIGRFNSGFAQRNTGLMEVLMEKRPGWELKPITAISQYTWGVTEAGPSLIAFKNVIGSKRLSDVVIFLDPSDVESDGRFSTQHVQAAQTLEQAGCRVHLVSVGGQIEAGNDQYMKDRVRLVMTDFGSSAELDAKLEQLLYNNVLPRLTVEFEPRNGATLEEDQRTQLQRAAANPSLRLIDSLGNGVEISKVSEEIRKKVLLWAKFNELATPLLMQSPLSFGESGTQNVTWLNTSINAESAQRMQEDKSPETQRMRAGIANLFIAAVTAASKDVKPSPVNFRASEDGRRIVAFVDTHQPFRVVGDQTHITSITRGSIGTIDARDLGLLQWTVGTKVKPYESETLEAQVTDHDTRIGTTTQTIRFFGLPPTVVRQPQIEALSNALNERNVVNQSEGGEANTVGWNQPGIPRSWYGAAVSVALMLVALLVART